MAHWTDKIEGIRTNPAHSYWLKEQLEVLLTHDCLDAARDAEYLGEVLMERWNSIANGEYAEESGEPG